MEQLGYIKSLKAEVARAHLADRCLSAFDMGRGGEVVEEKRSKTINELRQVGEVLNSLYQRRQQLEAQIRNLVSHQVRLVGKLEAFDEALNFPVGSWQQALAQPQIEEVPAQQTE